MEGSSADYFVSLQFATDYFVSLQFATDYFVSLQFATYLQHRSILTARPWHH